jgi:hypothetical protein
MLKVPDLSEFPNPIEEHQFTCRAVTANAVWLVQDTCSVEGSGPGSLDSLVWGNLIDQAKLDVLTNEFENNVWGTVAGALGANPVDHDQDPRIWIILATIRDAYVQDPKDRNVFVYMNPEDVDGSGLFNRHPDGGDYLDCYYINLHAYSGSAGQLLVADEIRRISLPTGLGLLTRTSIVPAEEVWLVKALGNFAQYATYGVTYTEPGEMGIRRDMDEFEKAPYLDLLNYQASSWKFDYIASRGQEFMWLMYLRQRFGNNIVPDITTNTDDTMLGMDNIAYAVNPSNPDIQADIAPVYRDWLVCNLYSSLESSYGGGIYTYEFLAGDSLNFAHANQAAAFTGKFAVYPIGLWLPAEGGGLATSIWSAQYCRFVGDYTGYTGVGFNGQYSDGTGSNPAVNGAWDCQLVTIDTTTMDIASLETISLDSWYNGSFTLANDESYLVLTNNLEGGASDLRYIISQDQTTPVVNLTMHQGLVSDQYVTLYTTLFNQTDLITQGFDWVGPIFTATLDDSTSNQAMDVFYGDIWSLRFSAWDDGTYNLVAAGFDSVGTNVQVTRQLSVGHVVTGRGLNLEIEGVLFDVGAGAAAPGSMIMLAESDELGMAMAAQISVEALGAMTGIVAGPVTISDVAGTLRFLAENGEAAIHRFDDEGWHQVESYYQGGYVCAAVSEGGVYALGDGPGISSPPLPVQLQLNGSFPNPFSSETMISFAVPSAGYVNLRVYDMSGRLVRTLADGDMTAANHSVTWDGRDHNGDLVGAGVYFCRLEAAGQIQTQKMLRVE